MELHWYLQQFLDLLIFKVWINLQCSWFVPLSTPSTFRQKMIYRERFKTHREKHTPKGLSAHICLGDKSNSDLLPRSHLLIFPHAVLFFPWACQIISLDIWGVITGRGGGRKECTSQCHLDTPAEKHWGLKKGISERKGDFFSSAFLVPLLQLETKICTVKAW